MPLLRPTKISHAVGSRGGPLSGQVRHGAQAGLLKGLLRDIEIAEVSEQRAKRFRPGRRQRNVDPGNVCHVAESPGLKT
jgi:hypothetical protein